MHPRVLEPVNVKVVSTDKAVEELAVFRPNGERMPAEFTARDSPNLKSRRPKSTELFQAAISWRRDETEWWRPVAKSMWERPFPLIRRCQVAIVRLGIALRKHCLQSGSSDCSMRQPRKT
ncbi:MAG: hypothetical protein MZV63_66660 [Marinilabiliales bacterium]|nr:hypothetical protein [Marinilabiliales bacterium]